MLRHLAPALKDRFADWRERLLGVDDPYAAWSSAAPDAGGRFECFGAWPSRHVAPRRVDVWLPPGYNEPEASPHAVLYMHDGQQLFDPATATAGHPWAVGHHVTLQMRAGRMRPPHGDAAASRRSRANASPATTARCSPDTEST